MLLVSGRSVFACSVVRYIVHTTYVLGSVRSYLQPVISFPLPFAFLFMTSACFCFVTGLIDWLCGYASHIGVIRCRKWLAKVEALRYWRHPWAKQLLIALKKLFPFKSTRSRYDQIFQVPVWGFQVIIVLVSVHFNSMRDVISSDWTLKWRDPSKQPLPWNKTLTCFSAIWKKNKKIDQKETLCC